MYYLKYFFLCSILGHIIETIVAGKNFESGILYGPWTVVYGLGSVILILIHKQIYKNIKLSKISKVIVLIISSFLLLTLAELLGGLLIEKIFNYTFWDYTNYKYNVGKYICLEISLIWIVASLIFLYLVKPQIDKFINKIPNIIVYILSILMILDIILTLIIKINIAK